MSTRQNLDHSFVLRAEPSNHNVWWGFWLLLHVLLKRYKEEVQKEILFQRSAQVGKIFSFYRFTWKLPPLIFLSLIHGSIPHVSRTNKPWNFDPSRFMCTRKMNSKMQTKCVFKSKHIRAFFSGRGRKSERIKQPKIHQCRIDRCVLIKHYNKAAVRNYNHLLGFFTKPKVFRMRFGFYY